MKTQIAVFCLLVVATVVRGQVVEIGRGPRDPHYCDKLTVEPNLLLEQDATVSGRLVDQSGAPFQNSPVDVRLYVSATKQSPVTRVTTDIEGRFRFHLIHAGRYRLIASPTRAFQQPSRIQCDSSDCEFSITLQVNPTDMPDSVCPVR